MLSVIQEKFEQNIANHIFRFLDHPTSEMIKRHFELIRLTTFDVGHQGHKWQGLYGYMLDTTKHYIRFPL